MISYPSTVCDLSSVCRNPVVSERLDTGRSVQYELRSPCEPFTNTETKYQSGADDSLTNTNVQVGTPHWLVMDSSIEKPVAAVVSDADAPATVHPTELPSRSANSKLELAELSLKVGQETESSVAVSPCVSPVSGNLLASRGRTAVWRQKVHSGAGAPVLAGQRILEFPSPTLATQIATVIGPGQRAGHETSRPESSSLLTSTLPVAYRSLPPASGLMGALTPKLMSPAPGIRLASAGLSPLPGNLPLYPPGLPLTTAGHRRMAGAPSGLSPAAGGCSVPVAPAPPPSLPRIPSRPVQSNVGSTKARSGHMCHSGRQDCSQYCLQGYKFCLWHILEDPCAPYKQCDFVEFPSRERCRFPVSLKSGNTRCVVGSA